MTDRGLRNGWPSRRRSSAVAVAAATIALAAAAYAAGIPSPAREGELIHLIRQDCGACHGMTLKGGLGAPLLPEALAGKDTEALAAIILDGLHGTPMPPWRPLLSEDEATWIARKLKEGLP